MATDTTIEWTDATFNPWRGCTKISAGCAHCYADALSARNPAVLGQWGKTGTRVPAANSAWREMGRWCRTAPAKLGRRPRVFVASLADVFEGPETMPHESVSVVELARARLWYLIAEHTQVDWLLLTKRPQNVRTFYPAHWLADPPRNVWLGTSVEDQATANERIPHLLRVPAAVRFISAEPLLGPVTMRWALWDDWTDGHGKRRQVVGHYDGVRGIHWLICGGESGPGARPMDPAWARTLRDQCDEAGIAFFMKQMGGTVKARMPEIPSDLMVRQLPQERGE